MAHRPRLVAERTAGSGEIAKPKPPRTKLREAASSPLTVSGSTSLILAKQKIRGLCIVVSMTSGPERPDAARVSVDRRTPWIWDGHPRHLLSGRTMQTSYDCRPPRHIRAEDVAEIVEVAKNLAC